MGFFENVKSGLMVGTALLFLASTMPVMAQTAQVSGNEAGVAELKDDDGATMDPNLYMGLQEAYQRNMKLRTPEVRPQEIKTLFFTLWQHKLLQEAKRQGASADSMTRNATDSELAAPENRVRGIREISLGGIVYSSTKDWVVWLNSQRITPDAIPKQVQEIKVHNDYVELKWFDSYTNLVFPVRLQAHQRFNLDSRIFLPGSPTL